MKMILRVFASTVILLVDVLQFIMLIHAILSWFPPSDGRGGVIRNFVNTVTEFVVAPVRAFLERFDWVRRTPLDVSFLITFLLLSFLSTFFSFL